MPSALETLLAILDLEPLEHNLFRGRSPQVGWQRVFGGLVISQALVAAQRTVEDRAPHSLHAYFILPGDPNIPIIYEVDRIRDGKSFATRRCVAIQPASLDHALWFHRPFRADDWLLYAQDSPSASGARGFSRGLIFTRDGTLVASVAQEGLIREHRDHR